MFARSSSVQPGGKGSLPLGNKGGTSGSADMTRDVSLACLPFVCGPLGIRRGRAEKVAKLVGR